MSFSLVPLLSSVDYRALRVLTRKPLVVVFVSAVLAAGCASLTAAINGYWFDWWVSFATSWGVVLAIAIYLISSADSDKLIETNDSLLAQVSELYGLVQHSSTPAPSSPLSPGKHEHEDYIEALMRALPAIPRTDIRSVDRPGDGKGNRPIIIATRHGKRYSVWKGGRHGGFTVNQLPPAED